jgi:hypothetical protein
VAANDGTHVCASARRPLNRRHSRCSADIAMPITASITTTEINIAPETAANAGPKVVMWRRCGVTIAVSGVGAV